MSARSLIIGISRLLSLASVVIIIGLLPWLSGQRAEYTILRARYTELEPSEAALNEIHAELGLDRHPLAILWEWFAGLFRGDFGYSWVSHEALFTPTIAALTVSLSLMAISLLVAMIIAVLLTVPVVYRGLKGINRRPNSSLSLALISIPSFVLAAGGILIFVIWQNMLPPYGWNSISSTILPSLSLGIPAGGLLGQLLSDSLSSSFSEPWVNTWRISGFTKISLLLAVLRRTLPAILPQIGFVIIGLTGGAVVIEHIFAIPGIGVATLTATNAQDIPALQAGIVMLLLLALVVGITTRLIARLLMGRATKNLPLCSGHRVPTPAYKLLGGICFTLLVGTILWGLLRDPHTSAHGRLAPPSWEIPLGADVSGRDLLARIGHGGFMTIGSALLIILAAFLVAILLGGLVNAIVGPSEVANALPPVIVGLMAVSLFGPHMLSALIAVTLITWAPLTAHAAALVREAKASPAVSILPTIGVGRIRTFFFHILPTIVGPVLRYAVLWLPGVALSLTLLSFLGLGPQPPTPDWGLILAEGIPYVEQAPLLVIIPWVTLLLTSILAAAAVSLQSKK